MRNLLRTFSVLTALIVWQWVHNYDNWSFYSNTQGTDVIALFAFIIVFGLCWWISNEATK